MKLTKRVQYLNQIKPFYDSNLIKVLTGIRRCGKSVLLKQIQEDLISSGLTDESHIISINFEDVRYSKIKGFLKLNNYILKQIVDDEKYYVFLDEIQHISQFEKTLSSLKATKNVSLFVTGSNSKLLSGRLASLLVGRCKEFKIMPFSYSEFIDFYTDNALALPEKPFNNYLRYGGMPQRFDYSDEEDIKSYLKSVFYGIVDKDICNSKSHINKENFEIIAKYILTNSAKEFSAQSIVTYFNKANDNDIYKENVYRYLEKLEQACLISRVKRYDISSKRNLKMIEKQFVIDNGILLACADSNNILASHSLENLVFNELIRRGYDVKIGKTYKGEIDFVAMKNNKKCFIQVAYLLADENIISREFGAYDSVRDASPKYVFSLDEFDFSRNGIMHINIIDWLLNKNQITVS